MKIRVASSALAVETNSMRSLLPRTFACTVLLTLAAFLGAGAAKKQGEAVSLKKSSIDGAVKPGATITAKLVFELDSDYHVHSHTPSEKNFIATVLTLKVPAGAVLGKIKYPPGKTQKVEGLAKLISIYDDAFELEVPITLPANLKLPLKIPSALTYQACQGAVCYPPRKLDFEILMMDATK